MNFTIINRENELGTVLETYGSAFVIPANYIKTVAVLTCLSTFGTNWLIPIICKKVKDIKIRHENKVLMRYLK